jgi:hypothetical protein
MTLNLTKLAVGAVAFATAGLLVATAAFAEPAITGKQGNYVLITDQEQKTCALAIQGNAENHSALIIAYTEDGGAGTAIIYKNDKIGDLTGKNGTITLLIDNDKYDWNGLGGTNSITVISDDPTVPKRLKDAQYFGLAFGDQPFAAVKSDADFEAAMTATVDCAHILATANVEKPLKK